MTHAYQHEPLATASSIRILDLLPSLNREAPVRCNIRHVQLASPEARYEALSYVWGARRGTQPIICNGRALFVTPNCVAALTKLRLLFRKRTLWIDAICIDQGTDAVATAERNKQVAMMGDLYRSAHGVIVWLGPGNDELTPRVFRYLKVLSIFKYWSVMDGPRVIRQMGKLIKPYVVSLAWPDGPGAPGKPRVRGPAFAKLMETLGSEWFSRIWTMQETITYGRCTVMCGTSTMGWSPFSAGMRDAGASHHANANAQLLYLRGRITDEILYPAEGIANRDFKSMHDVQLLKAMCKLQCSIPHDKVYGLYAILPTRGLHLQYPDYDRPLNEVLEETARAYVQCKKKLDILRITIAPSESTGLPSWVPDWLSGQAVGQLTCSDITGTAIVCWGEFPSAISSCCGALASPTDVIPHTPGKLTVKGTRIGSIKALSAGAYVGAHPVSELSHFLDFISTCREWCRMVASTGSYPTGEDPVLAGLRAITNHHGYFLNGRPLDGEHLMLWYKALLDDGAMSGTDKNATEDQLQPQRRVTVGGDLKNAQITQTVQSYVNYKANYAFFTLDSGYFGSAFNTSCRGDDIYLLAGLDVPCVLRRRGNEFRFVAIAHVHGVMRGQLWPKNEDDLEGLTLV
ncbi:heterokaryon incompatibility protein-domain-containing protein [Xylaria bambusicola]|uniref:heterokaryon incompatibility protein-domain-containing protein n=1 Tax=Xylaria bambusicola TaxID=326684 RepID=UPI002007E4A1|nr:heterokaryon incompatibility protein-domain-containing protein [Xylaria bambusicola]KAI0509152.1 heterokaryon incompatibility protein-domain-containing protein [Xylaria bambusicola]